MHPWWWGCSSPIKTGCWQRGRKGIILQHTIFSNHYSVLCMRQWICMLVAEMHDDDEATDTWWFSIFRLRISDLFSHAIAPSFPLQTCNRLWFKHRVVKMATPLCESSRKLIGDTTGFVYCHLTCHFDQVLASLIVYRIFKNSAKVTKMLPL
jgi:hypothetical protein